MGNIFRQYLNRKILWVSAGAELDRSAAYYFMELAGKMIAVAKACVLCYFVNGFVAVLEHDACFINSELPGIYLGRHAGFFPEQK